MSNDESASEVPVLHIRCQLEGQPPIERKITEFPCRIGRSQNCDIVISDSSISSLHALISKNEDGDLILEDQWSTNGIYMHFQRVRQVKLEGTMHLVRDAFRSTCPGSPPWFLPGQQ